MGRGLTLALAQRLGTMQPHAYWFQPPEGPPMCQPLPTDCMRMRKLKQDLVQMGAALPHIAVTYDFNKWVWVWV